MNEEADIWNQLDIDDWEEPDSEGFRCDVPEGFEWECCRNALHIKGCVRGRHEAHPDRSKRGRESPHYKREHASNPAADEQRAVLRDENEDEDDDEDEEDEEDEDDKDDEY